MPTAQSLTNIRVNVPSRFTFGIGTVPELMNNAAERLLSLDTRQIEEAARDIIYGQLRATIAMMDIEEINGDREKFESRVLENIESELIKIGLRLINVNISDITDESGYIEALGQRAAAEPSTKPRCRWRSRSATAPWVPPKPSASSASKWPTPTPRPSPARTKPAPWRPPRKRICAKPKRKRNAAATPPKP